MAFEVVNPFASTSQLNGVNLESSRIALHATNGDLSSTLTKPADNLRVHGVTVFRPIIYGNVSYRLDKPPSRKQTSRGIQDDNQEWFRWTVYVRGIENEDLSYFIKKVVFYLHDSYTDPIRVIENAPFELTEHGWGQFEIKIEIFFHDIPGLQSKNKHKTKRRNNNAMDIDTDNDENESKHKNDELMLDKVRSYNDMMNLEQTGVSTMALSENRMKWMIKDKESDIDEIIPSIYDDTNDNMISLKHDLRLFAHDKTEDSKKGIIEETFSEIEFIDPYYSLYEKLVIGPHKLIQQHPFIKHWKNRVVHIAQSEQLLIQTISETHRDLLKKIKAANLEYQKLCNNNTNHKTS